MNPTQEHRNYKSPTVRPNAITDKSSWCPTLDLYTFQMADADFMNFTYYGFWLLQFLNNIFHRWHWTSFTDS